MTNLLIFGQNKGDFTLGVNAGVNFSFATGTDIKDVKDEIRDNDYIGGVFPRSALKIGGIASYSVFDNLAVKVGLNYSPKGWWYYTRDTDDETTNAKFRLNYLDFPILIEYYINESIYAYGGPVIAFLLSDRVKTKSEYYDFDNNLETKRDNYSFKQYFWDRPSGTVGGIELGIGKRFDNGWFANFSLQKTGLIMPDLWDYSNLTLSIYLTKAININKLKDTFSKDSI